MEGRQEQVTWDQGGGRPRAVGRETAASEPGYNSKTEGVSLSGWSLAPQAYQAKAAGCARLHQRSPQDQQGTRDHSACQRWSCTGPWPCVRCPIATPALVGVSAARLGRLARPWALGIPHAALCQGDSPDRRAHRQAGRTRPWSPTPARPDSWKADRFLWGHLLTRERGEVERLPPHVGLSRERRQEESRRLGR